VKILKLCHFGKISLKLKYDVITLIGEILARLILAYISESEKS